MTKLPAMIQREVIAEQERLGWPDMVPAWVEIIAPNGTSTWCRHGDLNVGLAEQACAGHQAAARKAIRRFERYGQRGWARRAAYHIIRARLYRCEYIGLIGKTDSTEDDMPFAHLSTGEEPCS